MSDADSPDPASPGKPSELHGLDPAELLARGLHSVSVSQTEVLVFVDGQEVARRILSPGRHVLGCAESCGIRIAATGVSDQHACLTIAEDGSMVLEDLGGAMGTFLDGQTIRVPTPVATNQTIQIGGAQILVLQSAASVGESTVAADGHATPPELARSTRYEVGPEIAKGGMGAVLSARQPSIRREVALKVMLRHASPHDRLRFIEEAQITGQLEHPNIVPVHELAVNERGQPYYTMKLVKGGTLKDILKLLAQGDTATVAKYPLAALLTIFQKVCDAVAFAHARGVIHRDLKPANIMVGEYGEVLLMDWGLAKVIGGTRSGASPTSNADHGRAEARPSDPIIATAREDQREAFATLDGAVMGTPQYMSPEQARGEVATLDGRSDLFSLGAILYELVTLLPLFLGKTTREILSNIKSGHIVLPNARLRAAGAERPNHLPGGAIPGSLEAVISKALAIERSQRYPHVADFQADLAAYQSGFATSAENAGARKQFTLLIKRHKALSTAIAASLLLIAGITAAFTTKVVAERNRTAAQRDRAQAGEQAAQVAKKNALEERNRAEAERAKAVAANAENLRHLHEASMADYATAGQRIKKDDRWGEGVTHLARALDLEPNNLLPAMRLYGTIAFGAPDKTNLPRCVLVHQNAVQSASFSPDGTRIVTASDDKTAQLWDAATGKPLGEPMHHEGQVTSVSFNPAGTRIVTASDDSNAQLWDATTGRPLGEPMRHKGPVHSASFSPNGARVVTASQDKTARLWDAATGKPLGEPMLHEDRVVSASFSPDGTRIITACYDKTARLWDTATGKPLGKPMRHENWVFSASFSPDGTRIVTASLDETARLWDAATGEPLREPMHHEGQVTSASFSPDGTRIVTVSKDQIAQLWDAATGKPLGEPMHHKGEVHSASFSPDGASIVTASDDQTAQLWDATTGKPLSDPMHHGGKVHSASFSPDGARIVTASQDKTAWLWDAATDRPLGEPMRHEDQVTSASFSPDDTRIVTASYDKTARLWDATTGKPLGEPMRHESVVYGASFSPDGTRILTASYDKTARLWDAATGKPLEEPMRHENSVWSASFSPDGTRIVTASTASYGSIARLWDAATGKPLGPSWGVSRVWSASFSPDGTRIVTASQDQTAQLWDATTGKSLSRHNEHDVVERILHSDWKAAAGKPLGLPMHHESVVNSASFSPDGTRIVTASDDQTARLWDAATGKPIGEPMHHEGKVHSASFSSDGKHVVTASDDETARVWDAATGKLLFEPMQHESVVNSASFSPDGTRIVTACADNTTRLWDVKSYFRLPSLTPEWVREWARAVAGLRFDNDGVLQPLPAEERVALLYAPHAGNDPWSLLARWVATDPAKRTIDPDSPHTCREIAERERDFGSEESLESALRYDPTVPLARLMSAKFEDTPQRAAFLRDYDLKRLPEDASLWERAAKALAEQHDTERAKRALEKLATLDADQARTLKSQLGL